MAKSNQNAQRQPLKSSDIPKTTTNWMQGVVEQPLAKLPDPVGGQRRNENSFNPQSWGVSVNPDGSTTAPK